VKEGILGRAYLDISRCPFDNDHRLHALPQIN
jgi:hypothetical protein